MTQKQKHTLSMWNLRRSADRTHPHTLSLPTDLTMWSHTIPQLQSLLPAARHLDCTGPSSAPFLHEALRNGVDDVNLINAAIWVLEWRFKVSLSDATSYDRELLEEAETKFQKISQSLDHLLTLYLEFPFKTTHKDTIGHIPQVIYKKDSFGNRHKKKPFSFDYKNEFGQISHVHGLVSDGTDIRLIPYLDRHWNLIVYNWKTNLWDNTRVSFAPDAWDLNPDGSYVHSTPLVEPCREKPGKVAPASYTSCCSNPSQHTLIATIGQRKYFEALGHHRRFIVV